MNEMCIKLATVCMIQDGDRVLLLNRSHDPKIGGYIAPGGKVEFPESPLDCAIREVAEETGLQLTQVVYKGLVDYVNPEEQERYMVFNYLATAFAGELLAHPPEGALEWVPLADIDQVPMQDWFRTRVPLFFAPGTFELHQVWQDGVKSERVTRWP